MYITGLVCVFYSSSNSIVIEANAKCCKQMKSRPGSFLRHLSVSFLSGSLLRYLAVLRLVSDFHLPAAFYSPEYKVPLRDVADVKSRGCRKLKNNAVKKRDVIPIATEKSAGVIYCAKGREVVSRNTYGSLGIYEAWGYCIAQRKA